MTTKNVYSRFTKDRKKYDYIMGQKVKKEIPERRIRMYEDAFLVMVMIGLLVMARIIGG